MEDSLQRTGLGTVDLTGGVPRELCEKVTISGIDYLIPKVSVAGIPIHDLLDYGGETPTALDSVNTPGTESPDIDCSGKSLIKLRVEYSANNVTAPFRIVLKDANVDVGREYSVKVTPANTAENDDIQESGYFHGESISLPVGGATSFRVVLADTPSNGGSVSVWGVAV